MFRCGPPYRLKVKISGEAGDGILSIGDILMKAAARWNYHSAVFKSFPANIRGGYSQALVTISEQKIISAVSGFDILLSLSRSSFETDSLSLQRNNVLCIEEKLLATEEIREKISSMDASMVRVISVPVAQLAGELSGKAAIRSTVALGIFSVLLGFPSELLFDLISERFALKGMKILDLNRRALNSGIAWSEVNLNAEDLCILPKLEKAPHDRIILEGNKAITLGALAAGCSFFASYPITPATLIGDYMAEILPSRGGFAYQAEDEIAALGAVIGASFSGAKSMTATSGPGLSLMQEFLGYASMIELPAVVIDVQRVGPSTGMPTKHGQDDFMSATFGGHGEAVRIIVAPVNVEDCFYMTIEAFNLAERYQCPVILLSDSALGMIKETVSIPCTETFPILNREILREWDTDKPYARFKLTENGINPIPVPGISPVSYQVTGIEHDEYALPAVSSGNRVSQMKKRFRKTAEIEHENESLFIWDLEEEDLYQADFSLVAWGFTASIAAQTVHSMREKGYRIAALYPRLLYPVGRRALERLARFSSQILVPETNFTGQYAHAIRMYTDLKPLSINVSRGEPFTPEEIEEHILAILK